VNQICLIIAAVFFGIGALLPALGNGGLKALNWLCAGLCFVTIAFIIGH